MKSKKYHIVWKVPNSIEQEVKSIPLTHKYMTAHFSGLEPTGQYKVAGLS